eukprot:TRINITY_DN49094_c0_g1_i1.p1 TRINITY_DN49094_c0_g1~~TRINITY_DN49094_c0_g1_i1.p1  ORF type:complete len:454 (+),score=36.91 TRINITY_DN49094_c0_g1_i1:86-1363(+)
MEATEVHASYQHERQLKKLRHLRRGRHEWQHRGLAPLMRVTLGLLAWAPQTAFAAMNNCTASPNCAAMRRKPCDLQGIIPNVCGDCLPGTFGGKGPRNTVCLSNESCAAIFPGEETCVHLAGSGQGRPFIVPFSRRCVCDDGSGLQWPTAPGMCAKLRIKLPIASALIEVLKCNTRTCQDDSCVPIATYNPVNYVEPFYGQNFSCRKQGEDHIQLQDNCAEFTRRQPNSALCGHAGFQATSTVFGALGLAPVDCELAPKCPQSVLQGTRQAESCCKGTMWSRQIQRVGEEAAPQAPGFCFMVQKQAASVSSGGNVSNSSNVSTTPAPTPAPYECLVRTSAPGWTGCSCLDAFGFTDADKMCSLTCEPPHCQLPAGGIRPVPPDWVSTQVPSVLYPAISHSSRGSCCHWYVLLFWLLACQPVSSFL